MFQPSETLLNQPAAVQADGITGRPRGSPVQVASAALVVSRQMRRHIQFPHRAYKILAVIGVIRCSLEMRRHPSHELTLARMIAASKHAETAQCLAESHSAAACSKPAEVFSWRVVAAPECFKPLKPLGIIDIERLKADAARESTIAYLHPLLSQIPKYRRYLECCGNLAAMYL